MDRFESTDTFHEPTVLKTVFSQILYCQSHDSLFTIDLDIREMSSYFERVQLLSSVLWDVGDAAAEIYVLDSGELVLHEGNATERLERGAMIGQDCFFSRQSRSNKLFASVDSVVYKLSFDQFDRMAMQVPGIALKFTRMALCF